MNCLLRNCNRFPCVRLRSSNYLPTTCVFKKLYKNDDVLVIQNRNYSLQETIDTLVRTQTGIFKSISESTPVEYLQNFLVATHDTTGLPWWATIICTTIVLRSCITLPLAIYQNYILSKVENLHLEMPEIVADLKKEMAYAVKLYDLDERRAKALYQRSLKKQWNKLIIRDNCHPFKSTILLWFQIPTWIFYSISLRNLVYMLPNSDADAHIRFLELSVGGFGWIPNLTAVDASWILPVTFGIINLTIIELQTLSKVKVPTRFQRYLTNFFRGVVIILVPISASVPSCLTLYWTTSSAFGLLQNIILMSPKIKRMCHIPKTASELDNPYQHVLAGIKYKMNFISRNKDT